MSAIPPTALEGTQAPSQIEQLWDRYRTLAYVLVAAIVGALGVDYGMTEYKRRQADSAWAEFTATLGMQATYTDQEKILQSVTESVGSTDVAKLESAIAAASEAQRPYLLAALASRAASAKQWDKAEAALGDLERQFPNHSLVKVTDYPVQAVEQVKASKDGLKPNDPKKPEYKAAEKGSAVSRMRAQIAAAKGYAAPAQFARIDPPADAPKFKVELSGGYGSFVIALMPQVPKHLQEALKLVEAGFWKDIAIDEIRRSSKTRKNPQELHFGLESTRGQDDRSKWTDTEPSTHQVDFEDTALSHFAGAVSARNGADGKSCADRLWICVEDAPRYDGERVLFGFVVEGLDNLKRVCEAPMTAQEEEQGIGKPSDAIRVVSVTKL